MAKLFNTPKSGLKERAEHAARGRERGVANYRMLKQQDKIEDLRSQAVTDPLTGLPNRRGLVSIYESMMADVASKEGYHPHRRDSDNSEQASRERQKVGLIFVDFDKFKDINDKHGHGVGDQALIHLAKTIKGATRSTDKLVRLGGDEFVVAVSLKGDGSDRDDDQIELDASPIAEPIDILGKIAENIRKEVEASPLVVGDAIINLTVSQGCAVARNSDEHLKTLLEKADEAAYKAKGKEVYQGKLFTLEGTPRNRVALYVDRAGEPVLYTTRKAEMDRRAPTVPAAAAGHFVGGQPQLVQ